jgi:radical SAM protein
MTDALRTASPAPGRPLRPDIAVPDFDRAPMVVIWEVTRACALACKHCRADAITRPHPDELSFEEGCRLMDAVKVLGSPIFVLTGGDPFLRKDFFDLAEYGTSIGLRVSASPSGTKLVHEANMRRAAQSGVRRVQFSLDGATRESHDAFRQVKGTFDNTIAGLKNAKAAGIEIQLGTTVTQWSLPELPRIAEIVQEVGATMWSVFFLVPVGRGKDLGMITPEEGERVLEWLSDLTDKVPFAIKTTEAPFFRRVVRQRAGLRAGAPIPAPATLAATAAPGVAMPGRIASFGVNDGKGFVFISHAGEICPSGFLELGAGNFRTHTLTEVYRDSPIFQALRDPNQLKGKCGVCEYRWSCGGSRARAWALTGDYLQEDNFCVYEPNVNVPISAD